MVLVDYECTFELIVLQVFSEGQEGETQIHGYGGVHCDCGAYREGIESDCWYRLSKALKLFQDNKENQGFRISLAHTREMLLLSTQTPLPNH